jgi:hypothetical protein
MKILKNEVDQYQLLMYVSNNYLYKPVYVVCYGLQVKQFDCKVLAQVEYRHCKKHAIECNKVG